MLDCANMSRFADRSLSSTCVLVESSSTVSALEEAITRSEVDIDLQLLIVRDAANIVRTIVSAVKYLHDQGIVHRGALRGLPSPAVS